MNMSVYLSATGSWSKLDLLPSFPNKIDYNCDCVYCNGAIHWYALGKNSVHFDIDSLCLKTLPTLQLPALSSDELEVVYFGGCGGNLHLIVGKIDENLRYDIWELKEDYSGWIDHSSRIFYERSERYVPYFHPPYFETLAAVTGYRDIIEY
ncbi:hypothetical protein PIB30_075318 [Stylosanthes scabra]|uniref:F-box associated domain-containing protein n=1 Tax=Stylosanthes scabra TaxID=79078 RepID=A0ABU6YPB2_9FABA|nr:hypothetical protein [Stylosanthes scabra]